MISDIVRVAKVGDVYAAKVVRLEKILNIKTIS